MKFKNPQTGQFQELYFKTLDSLPVGSIVDYSGDSVPDGWVRVDESMDYSTTEIATCMKWIDGKTIYRKVVAIPALASVPSGSNQGSAEIATDLTNVDYVINIYGTIKKPNTGSGNATFPVNAVFPYTMNSNQIFTYYSDNSAKIKIYYGDAFVNSTGYVVLEYTKTTL